MGSNPAPGPLPVVALLRKAAAVLLVLASLTAGIIGLGFVTGGQVIGVLLLLTAPFGVYAATRVAPEGGSSSYCDDNI